MGWLEPSADVRHAAKMIRQMYEAYIEVGFTPSEAMQLIGFSYQQAANNPPKREENGG